MPFVFDRSLGTSINIDSDNGTTSITNDSAARKFAAPDISFEQSQDATIRTNEEHLIEHAAGLKGMAAAADIIAQQARMSLSTVRDQLSVVQGAEKGDIRTPVAFSSEVDQALLEAKQANSLFDQISQNIQSLDVRSLSNDLKKRSSEIAFSRRTDLTAPPTFNDIIPQFDRVSIELDKNRGAADCFFAVLKFSLPTAQIASGKIKAIRIFRSTIMNPRFSRGAPQILSMRAIERLSSSRIKNRSKGGEALTNIERRFREMGVPNALTSLSAIDPTTNLRVSSNITAAFSSGSKNPTAMAATSRFDLGVSSFIDPTAFPGIDQSVLQNLNVVNNLRNQMPVANTGMQHPFVLNTAEPIRRGLLNLSQDTNQPVIGIERLVIDANNAFQFREIGFLSLDKIRSTTIGDHVEYTFQDESVGYGVGYKYYLVSVDKDMIESTRSQMIEVTVEGVRIPERPKRIFVQNVQDFISLNVIVEDQLVEKFEIYRREADRGLIKFRDVISPSYSSAGFNVGVSLSVRSPNGFIKIGEGLNGSSNAGSNFYDRTVIPGRKYIYRVYSVDIFGNKSESPYEFDVFVPDRVSKQNELLKPTLNVEVDATTSKARVVFKCGDARVKNLFITRRDITIGQKAFTAPSEVNEIKLGSPKAGEGSLHFEGQVLRGEQRDVSWTGFFENNRDETVYIDRTVTYDHVYQYRIHGVDLYGNVTPYEYSKPVMITRRAMIDAPINVAGNVVQGRGFVVGGVKLSWHEANIDISTEDRLGSRDALRNTSVRTLYQVERKKLGEEKWYEFPMVEDTSFFDASAATLGSRFAVSPKFRPPPVEANQTYVYRVKAMQTGSFVSNYSSTVEVFAALPVVTPTNFRVRSSDTRVSPFYVVLNWDTSNASGIVDKWEIQRCEINNFAASRINNKNADDLKTLKFSAYREVFRESSRFNSQAIDYVSTLSLAKPQAGGGRDLFSGQHQFQDTNLTLGNTYFYRIRSVGLDGSMSDWSYRGIKLSDQSTERLLDVLLSIEDRKQLSETMVPLFMVPAKQTGDTSFAMQPAFSKPDFIPQTAFVDTASTITRSVPVPTFGSQDSVVKNG